VPGVLARFGGFVPAAGFAVALFFFGCSNAPITGASSIPVDANGKPVRDTGSRKLQGTEAFPETILELEEGLHETKLASQSVTLEKDPVYGTKKTYQTYPLLQLARSMKDFAKIEAAAKSEPYALVFAALDRFKIILPFEYLFNGKGFLAFKESARPDGNDWEIIPAQTQAKTPAPYYLIWQVPDYSFDFPTPYMVAYFKIIPMRKALPDAAPQGAGHDDGFSFFGRRCAWCHSVNYAGGRSGKELNVPQSVTERMTVDGLTKYVRGQGAYPKVRPGCAMMWLKDKEITSLWDYFSAKKAEKVCDSEKACEKFAYK